MEEKSKKEQDQDFVKNVDAIIDLTKTTIKDIKEMNDYQEQLATFDKGYLEKMEKLVKSLEGLKKSKAGIILGNKVRNLQEKEVKNLVEPLIRKTITNPVMQAACKHIQIALTVFSSPPVIGYVLSPKAVQKGLSALGINTQDLQNHLAAQINNFTNELEVYENKQKIAKRKQEKQEKPEKGKEEEKELEAFEMEDFQGSAGGVDGVDDDQSLVEVGEMVSEEDIAAKGTDITEELEGLLSAGNYELYKTIKDGLEKEFEGSDIAADAELKSTDLADKDDSGLNDLQQKINQDLKNLDQYEKQLDELVRLQAQLKRDPIFILHQKVEAIFEKGELIDKQIQSLYETMTIDPSSTLNTFVKPFVDRMEQLQKSSDQIVDDAWDEKKNQALQMLEKNDWEAVKNSKGLFSDLIGKKTFEIYLNKMLEEGFKGEGFSDLLVRDISDKESYMKKQFVIQNFRGNFSAAVKKKLGYDVDSMEAEDELLYETKENIDDLKSKFQEVQQHIDTQKPINEITQHYNEAKEALQTFMDNTYTRFWKAIDKIADFFKISADHKPAALQYYHQAKEIKKDIDEYYKEDIETPLKEGEVDDGAKVGMVQKWREDVNTLKNGPVQLVKEIKRGPGGFFTPHRKDARTILDAVQKLDEQPKPKGGNMGQG